MTVAGDEAPRLTLAAAMLLVDQRLHDDGSTETCARDEVEAAFTYLTSSPVGDAGWDDPGKTAIVVTAAPL